MFTVGQTPTVQQSMGALPVYSLQKFSLMCSDFACIDFAHQFSIFVDEPRFAQHVRSRVLQLEKDDCKHT